MKQWQQITRSALAVVSFAAITVGFWLAWQPLGLIVPGSIIFGSLVYSHLQGVGVEEATTKQEQPQA